jgi:hypothetical protein
MTGFSEGSAHAVFMVDRVSLERVSCDLLLRPVSIVSPVPSTHLMLAGPTRRPSGWKFRAFWKSDAVGSKWQGRQWEVHKTATMWFPRNTWDYHSEGSDFSILLDLCTKVSAQILKDLTKCGWRIPRTVNLLVPSVGRCCLGSPKICVTETAQGVHHLGKWVYKLALLYRSRKRRNTVHGGCRGTTTTTTKTTKTKAKTTTTTTRPTVHSYNNTF